MFITFDYFSITLLLGGFTALLSGIIVFLRNRFQLENQAWLALNVSSAVWSFAYFAMVVAPNKEIAVLSNIILHGAAIFIPVFYFLMILAVTKTYTLHRRFLSVISFLGVLLLIVNPTHYFVSDVFEKGPFRYAPDAGPLYVYFTIFFFAIVLYALWITYQLLRKETNPIEKGRLRSIILFTIAGFGGGGSVFFLTFNINIAPYPLILFSLYPVISGYAIFKYQLFDTKVITTQLVTFALWMFILIRTLLADTLKEQLINGGLLLITIIFGMFLIRSVLREVKTREKIEELAKNLEKTNKDLEGANARLQELDQLKSEFVSLATHQIRGPLTAIKGYASLIVEGDYGKVSAGVKEAVNTILHSAQSLVVVVGDFLDVSRIEQGRMKYDFKIFDLKGLVQEVVSELKPNLDRNKLDLSVSIDQNTEFLVDADRVKIKQVIANIFDNSIKYTPKGSIAISLTKNNGKILFAIKDTGIGIHKDTIPKLFAKFSRAKDANETNIIGTGLGLYLARELIKGHNGRVWAESEGQGKGSQFYIELNEAEG
ncbi:MAG: hypothetical protein RLZZ347_758 [Candidatus Parcubacteria bacterium]|jgi:signal transduction histidine kinase